MACPKFFGKYRGKVENNLDPQRLGRVQVSVPAVLGEGTMSWALPSMPFAGSGVGFFAVPPKGANVWVEFEGGDPDYPIWTGCFWGTLDIMPVDTPSPLVMTIKTLAGSITLDGLTQTITIKDTLGLMKLSFSPSGIQITNGTGASIDLSPAGPSVKVNNGALEVT